MPIKTILKNNKYLMVPYEVTFIVPYEVEFPYTLPPEIPFQNMWAYTFEGIYKEK